MLCKYSHERKSNPFSQGECGQNSVLFGAVSHSWAWHMVALPTTCRMMEDQTWSCTANPLVMAHSKSQVSFRATHRHQSFGKWPWRPVGRHGALGGSHGHDPCRPQPLSATQARKNSGGKYGWQGASRPLGSYRRLQVLCLCPCPWWLVASGQGHRPAMQLQLQPHASVQSA